MSHDESRNDELYIPTEIEKESVLIFNNKPINNKGLKNSRFDKPMKGRKIHQKVRNSSILI